MKLVSNSNKSRTELSALATVVALLTAGVAAKSSIATLLLHLSR